MRKTLGLIFCALLLTKAGFPQSTSTEAPTIELFGGYSYKSLDEARSHLDTHGWEASGTFNFNSWLGLKLDFDGHYHDGSIATRQYNAFFGPEFSFRNRKGKLFVHVLYGGACLGSSVIGAGGCNDASALGGGGDFNLSPHWGWRVGQVDYLRTRFEDKHAQENVRFSSGIVYRW